MKQKVVQIVDMPIDEIVELIVKKTKPGKSFWPSDIAMKYNLDFDDVNHAVNLLCSKGKLQMVKNEKYDVIHNTNRKSKTVQIGNMPIEKITELILKKIKPGTSFYASDIAMKYNLDFDDVDHAMDLLHSKGLIQTFNSDYDDYGVVWP